MRSYYDLRTSANSDDEVVKLKKSIRWNLALFGAFFLEFVVAILDVISRFTPYGLFEMSDDTYNKWYVFLFKKCSRDEGGPLPLGGITRK